ncbi:MAG: hypothetical protein J7496_02760 [Novosphingobium sp.]|nr:hypothetical protein [Novosphingobium sp.]MBO9601410.1 hypothetical protein [Novosphingobium sp.]
MSREPESKLANAQFANARLGMENVSVVFKTAEIVGLPGGARILSTVSSVLEAFSRHYGGLWVGGKVTLYDDRFVFEPNAMNQFVHQNGEALCFDVPLREIETVKTRPGLLTDIIDIEVSETQVSVRCFGAKKFAERIRTAMMEAASA